MKGRRKGYAIKRFAGQSRKYKPNEEQEVNEDISGGIGDSIERPIFIDNTSSKAFTLEAISRCVRHRIVWSTTFDRLILVAIFANCIFIAMDNPLREDDHPLKMTLQTAEKVFAIIFIIEMVIKWIGLGWCGKCKLDVVGEGEDQIEVEYCGYFHDGWNILDFVIVLSSLTTFATTEGSNTSSIRILRVLRPLRTIAKVKELRILVQTIFNSLQGLADVGILLVFIAIIFAIIGTQLFAGTLRQRCFYDINPNYTDENWDIIDETYSENKFYFKLKNENNPPLLKTNCTSDIDNTLVFQPPQVNVTEARCFVTDTNHTLTYFAEQNRLFQENYYDDFLYYDQNDEMPFCDQEYGKSDYCLSQDPVEHPNIPGVWMASSLCLRNHENPDAQMTCFDNIFFSLLMVFVVSTLEGWVDIMYKVQVTYHPSAFIFFILLTLLASYFSLNLCIAVMEDVYSESVAKENNDEASPEVKAFVLKHMPKSKCRVRSAYTLVAEEISPALVNNQAQQVTSIIQDKNKTLKTEKVNVKKLDIRTPTLSPSEIKSIYSKEDANLEICENITLTDSRASIKDSETFKETNPEVYRTTETNREPVDPSSQSMSSIKTDNAENTGMKFKQKDSLQISASKDFSSKFDTFSPSASQPSSTTRLRSHSLFKDQAKILENYDPNILREISSYTIRLAKPKDGIKMGKTIGHIKKDPLAEFQSELINRKKIALTALAMIQTKPDEYFKKHKNNRFIMTNRDMAKSRWFNDLILLIIVLNTISLAIYWPDISEETENLLETFNLVFTVIFNVEMVIKLIGLGPKAYISDNWNVFDGLVVIVSDFELLAKIVNPGSDSGAISAFRIFRLLRIFRVLGQIESLKIILGSVVSSAGDVTYLCLILLLFIFMFSTLGISLFSAAYYEYGDANPGSFPSGRWRFDDIHWSMLTVFQCITGDAWNAVMFDTKEATDSDWVSFYFVVVVVFGGFIVLNLFIAILLSRMGGEDEKKWTTDFAIRLAKKLHEETKKKLKKDKEGQPIETMTSIAYKRRRIVEAIERRQFIRAQKIKKSKTKSNRNKKEIEGYSLGIFGKDNKFRIFVHRFVTHWGFDLFIDAVIIANAVFLMLEEPKLVGDPVFEISNMIFAIIFIVEMFLKVIAMGLLPFPIFSKVRWKLLTGDDVSEHSAYEYFTLQALDTIYEQDPGLLDPIAFHKRGLVTRISMATSGVVIVEWQTLKTMRLVFKKKELMAVYIQKEPGVDITRHVKLNMNTKNTEEISWHCWKSTSDLDAEVDKICRSHDLTNRCHNSYLSSKWNQLDAFVVFVSVLGFIAPDQKVIQGLRGIRPLRIAVRLEATKVILSSLIRACPAMVNVFIFCFSFWIVLAILGMDWFAGQFQTCACLDEKFGYAEEYCYTAINGSFTCINMYDREDCEKAVGCVWEDEIFNFNHVFQSMHTLFVVASMSGWNDVMYRAIDTNGLYKLPKTDNRVHASVYFVAVILVCAFFSLNLIISVVVDNFQRIKSEKDGSALMTEDQWKWVQTRRVVSRLGLGSKVFPPKASWRLSTYQIVIHPFFEPTIQGCIILNTLTMCLEFYNAPSLLNLILSGLEAFYIAVFAIEAVLKIVGFGWRQYWRSNWNKFDLFIVVVGVVSLLELTGDASLNVLRLFRIGRVLRLINKAKTLKTLFLTLMYSIPSLWNIGLLLIIVLFVYAVIGMHLFEGKDDITQWEFGDDRACFKDFNTAFGTLVRISSGDGWTDLYERYLGDVDDKASVYFYFCSFFFLGALVMINLFIAVILESFEEEKEAMKREQDLKTIKVWRVIWQEYDKESIGTVLATEFVDMLKHVPQPVGFFNIESLEQMKESPEANSGGVNLDGPSHRDVLSLLLKLNLFVEKKPHGKYQQMLWCVDYEDALLCYVTMFMGPEIDVEPSPDIQYESMGAADWYALETNTIDLLNTLVEEYVATQRKNEMSKYILDIYVEDLMNDNHENAQEFGAIEGLQTISGSVIELQKQIERESSSSSTKGLPV